MPAGCHRRRPRWQRREGHRSAGPGRGGGSGPGGVPRARPHRLSAGGSPARSRASSRATSSRSRRSRRRRQRCAAVVGFVEEDGDLYNAAAVCAAGEVHGIVRKQLLPNYGVFDERRYFAPGSEPRPALPRSPASAWASPSARTPGARPGPVGRLGEGGAELVVTVNASPYRAGVLAQRERMLATRAADASCALAYVNLVGGQDELVFDGASMVFDHDGNLVASAPQFDEALVICDLVIRPTFRKRLLDPRGHEGVPSLPLTTVSEAAAGRREPCRHATVGARWPPASARWRRSTRRSCSGRPTTSARTASPTCSSALSGGVDSSLVATIAADAARQRAGARRPDAVAVLVGGLGRRRRGARREPRNRHHDCRNRAGAPRAARDARAGVRHRRPVRRACRREPPGSHPRHHPHGDLERARLARAHDGQQERDGGRLRHAVRRHGRRLRA